MEPPAAIHFLLAVANPLGKTIMGYLAVRRPDIANTLKKWNKGNVAREGRERSARLLRAVKYLLKIIANSIKYKSNNNVSLGTTGVFLTYWHIYATVAKNTQILQFRKSVGSQRNTFTSRDGWRNDWYFYITSDKLLLTWDLALRNYGGRHIAHKRPIST